MKTRIEIANTKIDKINQELKEFYVKREVLKKAKLVEFSQVLNKYFLDCLEEGDEITTTGSKIEFLRPQEGYSHKKDILNLYLKDNWSTGEIEKIQTSFYSTTGNSEFELRRMILLGQVGQVLLDFSDDIVGELNQIIDKYSKELKEVDPVIYNFENQIRDIKNDIDKFEKEDLLSKAKTEGVTVKEGVKLPDFDPKNNYTLRNIKGLRVLEITPSGKTAKVEITQDGVRYNPVTSDYENAVLVRVEDRVRMDRIEGFLFWNKEKFSVS